MIDIKKRYFLRQRSAIDRAKRACNVRADLEPGSVRLDVVRRTGPYSRDLSIQRRSVYQHSHSRVCSFISRLAGCIGQRFSVLCEANRKSVQGVGAFACLIIRLRVHPVGCPDHGFLTRIENYKYPSLPSLPPPWLVFRPSPILETCPSPSLRFEEIGRGGT